MAEGKNSFLLYTEYEETFEELSDEDAGQLIKHLFRYVNDRNPETKNPLVKVAFIQIKNQLKRDLKKWDSYIEKQRLNGKKGGRPPKPKETQKTQAFSGKPKKADNVDVDVYDNNKEEIDVESFRDQLAEKDHQIWRESWYMKFKMKPKSLSVILDQFNIHLGLKEKEEIPKTLKDYKQHFYNWCNVQDRLSNLSEYQKGKKEGAL